MQNFDYLDVAELNFNEMSDIDGGGAVATGLKIAAGVFFIAGEILNYMGL
ncbi:hypothetical protein [Spirosoma flavum]|uniref:Class IIb bacteriocin, lactobin A/cerein 7B family n=1 Tax=Spirosoma flavum TaxID=2048557 RepID=A0ABW6AH86_9BACT